MRGLVSTRPGQKGMVERQMRSVANNKPLEKLLNVKQVAEFLGVKRTMVYRLLAEGTIPTLNITDCPYRRTLRVRPSALLEWLNGREVN